MIFDTICAISTAYGEAGIAVIRVSGDQAIRYTNRLFHGANLLEVKSHSLTHGWIKDFRNNDFSCFFQARFSFEIIWAPETRFF